MKRYMNLFKSLFERRKVAINDGDQFEIPTTSREGELDQHSTTWAFVEHWAVSELQKARENNDSTKRDAVETAALRGRIRMLKELIDLPKPKARQRRIPIPLEEQEF